MRNISLMYNLYNHRPYLIRFSCFQAVDHLVTEFNIILVNIYGAFHGQLHKSATRNTIIYNYYKLTLILKQFNLYI